MTTVPLTPGDPSDPRPDHVGRDAQSPPVGAGPDSLTGHTTRDSQETSAGEGTPVRSDHERAVIHGTNVGADSDRRDGSAATVDDPTPNRDPSLVDPFLRLSAEILDDYERVRIANENRLRQLTRTDADTDGEHRGFGLTVDHPDVASIAATVDALKALEHGATLSLKRVLRRNPLHPWIKAQRGVGDKQIARLLAAVGDPYLHPDGRPRLVSELWSYAGHGDATRRKRRGLTQAELFAAGNPVAKQRVYLIAESCLKAQDAYADVYYARRSVTADRVHAAACVRCGPSGRPAAAGSPWSAGHQHADALRIVGKRLLRDLWLESRRLHQTA